ncbi:sugar ABC transporter [Agarivorans sp. TSD2052]|uniref:ABC transporter substrate-binding protein n=1 Tax=Agarivorans sp. TSD2052 TaxID=2937286 RepID=UPI00200C4E0E|nr:sugar ABC transporter [Agarivorans sp. TSD2052]UPW18586.1 sugar ABC transporter [Agarivorans sp. TSD2052]
MHKFFSQLLGISALLCAWPVFATQTVLVIESYHAEYAWDISYRKGIESVLKEGYQLEYFQMDTKRLPINRHRSRAEMAWQHHLDIKPDLVILGDDNALRYLGKRFAKSRLPVVYLGINNNPRAYHVHKRKNITGVLERPLIKRSVSNIAELVSPAPKRILVMLDDSVTAKNVLQETFSGETEIRISGIDVQLKLIKSWSEWQNTVLTLQDEGFDAVAFGLYHTLRDDSNKHVDAEQVIAWSSENTAIPPFGFWEFAVGKNKTIGGMVLFGFEQGRLAAEMAHTILTTDVVPRSLGPKTADKGRYLFSRSQLERYNITLPQNIADKATYVD